MRILKEGLDTQLIFLVKTKTMAFHGGFHPEPAIRQVMSWQEGKMAEIMDENLC